MVYTDTSYKHFNVYIAKCNCTQIIEPLKANRVRNGCGTECNPQQALQDQFVRIIYTKTCDSLFEKDKLMFSLLLAFKSMDVDGELNHEEKTPPKALRKRISQGASCWGPSWGH